MIGGINIVQRFDLRLSALVEEEISRGDSLEGQSRLAFIEDIPRPCYFR